MAEFCRYCEEYVQDLRGPCKSYLEFRNCERAAAKLDAGWMDEELDTNADN